MTMMKAVVFKGQDRLAVEDVPKPRPAAGEALIRITATTICGTDVHIVRGEYPVKPGLILFSHQREGVLKVALHPFMSRPDRMPHLVGARARNDQC